MNPFVSVLIPVFNRANLISKTLESALNQSYDNYEVIVVDNCSEDGTWQILKAFELNNAKLKIFRNEKNIGPVENWLKCLSFASGEYVKILWSDDLIAQTFLEKTMNLFNKEVAFIYSGAKIFSGDNHNLGRSNYLQKNSGVFLSTEFIISAIYDKGTPVSPGCAIFRTKDVRENLWIDIPNNKNINFGKIAIGNDLLLFLLTANKYKYVGHVAEILSYFRDHEGSISIKTENRELVFLHTYTKAFFVKNYFVQELGNFSSYIKFLIYKFGGLPKFGLVKLEDFYLNKYENINVYFLLKLIAFDILYKIKLAVLKFR